MAQPGVPVSRREVEDEVFPPPRSGDGVPGRRTVTIRGQGADGYVARSRSGSRSRTSGPERRRDLRVHERSGFRPDKVAMWAVLLGVMLVLVAATSAHAAIRSPAATGSAAGTASGRAAVVGPQRASATHTLDVLRYR